MASSSAHARWLAIPCMALRSHSGRFGEGTRRRSARTCVPSVAPGTASSRADLCRTRAWRLPDSERGGAQFLGEDVVSHSRRSTGGGWPGGAGPRMARHWRYCGGPLSLSVKLGSEQHDSQPAKNTDRSNASGKRLLLERETGFEPATPTLARSCSTTELFPRTSARLYHAA